MKILLWNFQTLYSESTRPPAQYALHACVPCVSTFQHTLRTLTFLMCLHAKKPSLNSFTDIFQGFIQQVSSCGEIIFVEQLPMAAPIFCWFHKCNVYFHCLISGHHREVVCRCLSRWLLWKFWEKYHENNCKEHLIKLLVFNFNKGYFGNKTFQRIFSNFHLPLFTVTQC